MSNNAKTCNVCKYAVPREATVCAHCGAGFVTVTSKSFFGRIWGGIKWGVGLYLFGVFVGGAISGKDAMDITGPIFGSIGVLIGLYRGSSKEISTLD
jgi:hypothetical protein